MLGDAGLVLRNKIPTEEGNVKVILTKAADGALEAIVMPGPKTHMPPVSIRGKDKKAVLEEVDKVVRQLKPEPGES